MAEWGNPAGESPSSVVEYIGGRGKTRGTEPSQYPGKRNQRALKDAEIPRVVASEIGGA